ncbi:MAG: polysaccharide biosynthesis/export family protein [Candidatus Xenobia bacterium]
MFVKSHAIVLMLLVLGMLLTTTARATPSQGPMSEAPLQPGDELTIIIDALSHQAEDVKIRDDGWVYVPWAGELHAAGLTLRQLQVLCEQRLVHRLRHPAVQIGLRSRAPSTAVVLGSVEKPGQYVLAPGTRMVDLIALAGGGLPGADQTHVMLLRGGQQQALDLARSEEAATLARPGDVLLMHASGRVGIEGSVVTPGAQLLTVGSMTVWRALVAAGGPRPQAALSRVELQRIGRPPQRLNLRQGSQARDAALLLQDGDVVTVPERRAYVVGVGTGATTGVVPLTGVESLVQVLGQAGVNPSAKMSVHLVRGTDLGKVSPPVRDINVAQALRQGAADMMVPVRDGDVVVVTTPGTPPNLGEVAAVLAALRVFFP